MTDRDTIQLVEHMGRCYRRSNVSMEKERTEAIRSILVTELEKTAVPEVVQVPVHALSLRTLFHNFVHGVTLRPVIATFVVLLIGAGALSTVAEASLPGDSLYTVKLVKERARVKLTVNQTNRAVLQTHLAKKRANEVRAVITRDEPREVKKERLRVAVQGLEGSVKEATETLVTLSEKKVLAEVVERETAVMVELLSAAKIDALESNGEVAETVGDALAFVAETNELVRIAASPPDALASSVAALQGREEVSEEDIEAEGGAVSEERIALTIPQVRSISSKRVTLLNPALSVSSVPFATSVHSPQNLPYAQSVQSARLPLAVSISSE
jgi:hypothetical protein